MNWVREIARPQIRALKPYQHATWEPGLVRLNANELPWRRADDHSAAGLNRYPEPYPLALYAALAELYGVEQSSLLACRGSDEAIDLLVRAYCRAGHDAIVVCPPTFGMYAVCARVQDAAALEVPLVRERGYVPDAAAILRAAESACVRLVFLCSPNNPTGGTVPAATVHELLAGLEGRALVVMDEAYVEFADTPSWCNALTEHPGLVVLRTVSKAHGLAGARCGSLIAHPLVIDLLKRVIQPYAIAQPSLEQVMAAIRPAPYSLTQVQVARVTAERARLAAGLATLPCVRRVWPSEANFVLVEFHDAGAALAHAHARGLLLRDVRSQPTLGAALRITVGDPQHTRALLDALGELR